MGQVGDKCISEPGPGALWTPCDVTGLCLRSGLKPLLTYTSFVVLCCCCFPPPGHASALCWISKSLRSVGENSSLEVCSSNFCLKQVYYQHWIKSAVSGLLVENDFLTIQVEFPNLWPLPNNSTDWSTKKNLALLSLQLFEGKLQTFQIISYLPLCQAQQAKLPQPVFMRWQEPDSVAICCLALREHLTPPL